jgi:signal transduction histidine kinase
MPDLVDELEAKLAGATELEPRVDALNALAYALLRSDAPRAWSLSEQALRLSRDASEGRVIYERGAAESLRTQARLKMHEGMYDQALILGIEALDLMNRMERPAALPSLLNTLGSCYRQLGDLSEALDYYRQQLQASESIDDREETARSLLGIGVIYFDVGDYASFLDYSERSLAIFRELGQDYWIGLALNNACYAAFKLGRYEDALQRGREAMQMSRQAADGRGLVQVLNTMAEIYLESGNVAHALVNLGDSLEQLRALNEPDLESDALLLTGQAYLKLENYEQALAAFKQAQEHSDRFKLRSNNYQSHRFLAETYKRTGDYAQALKHQEIYHAFKEAVHSEESEQKIHNLEVLYHTQAAQKEAEYFARLYEQTRQFNEQLEDEVRKRTEDLRAAYEQLERLGRTKSNFITVTAHELRTPLTVLQGYAQILLADPGIRGDAYKNELANGMLRGLGRLAEIINTMLLMVKIDSQALDIQPEPINLAELLLSIFAGLMGAARQRNQTLSMDPGVKSLGAIQGDRSALAIVFQHLIGNAIKYTPDGGVVRIHGRAWQQAPQAGWPERGVEVVVSDTGIGIDPADRELIFTRFYQTGEARLHSSSKTSFKGGGPGLGLAIAQGIIEAHFGMLWVESEGHDEQRCPGSHFHIVLPVEIPFG